MAEQDELAARRAENAALRAETAPLRADLSAALDVIAHLEERVAELEQRRPPPPPFVRANTPGPQEEPPRTRRARRHNAGRRREEPTRVVLHALEHCPDCGDLLRGWSVARTRQIVDLPDPAAPVVTEHRFLKRHCPACGRWPTPRPDWGGQALGQGRCGPRSAPARWRTGTKRAGVRTARTATCGRWPRRGRTRCATPPTTAAA